MRIFKDSRREIILLQLSHRNQIMRMKRTSSKTQGRESSSDQFIKQLVIVMMQGSNNANQTKKTQGGGNPSAARTRSQFIKIPRGEKLGGEEQRKRSPCCFKGKLEREGNMMDYFSSQRLRDFVEGREAKRNNWPSGSAFWPVE